MATLSGGHTVAVMLRQHKAKIARRRRNGKSRESDVQKRSAEHAGNPYREGKNGHNKEIWPWNDARRDRKRALRNKRADKADRVKSIKETQMHESLLNSRSKKGENMKGTKKAYEWLRKNTNLDADTFMLDFEQLKYAVDHGILLQIADTDVFIPKIFENAWGKYEIKEVYKVPEEIAQENLLIYPYRFKAALVEPSKEYDGLDEQGKSMLKEVDTAITEIADYSRINNAMMA